MSPSNSEICQSAKALTGHRFPRNERPIPRRRSNPTKAEASLKLRPVRVKREPKRSEEHTSELQSQSNLVCRLLLEKKKSSYHYPERAACTMTPSDKNQLYIYRRLRWVWILVLPILVCSPLSTICRIHSHSSVTMT